MSHFYSAWFEIFTHFLAGFLGEIAMILKSQITASMRNAKYQPMAAVTCNGHLSAAKCDCKAGSARPTDRGVCVHILPMLLQLSLLLFDGLAQNLLVELSHRWNENLEEEIENLGEMTSIKDSISILLEADGFHSPGNVRNLDVRTMLKPYSVGTEKEKIVHFLPREDELLPLRELQIISTQKMMKVALKRDRKSKKRLRVENEDDFFNNKAEHQQVDSDKEDDTHTQDQDQDQEENTAEETIFLRMNSGTSTFLPLPCDFCNSNIMSTHLCRVAKPDSNRMIEGTNSRICGKSTCILCYEGAGLDASELRSKCKCCALKSREKGKNNVSKKIDKMPASENNFLTQQTDANDDVQKTKMNERTCILTKDDQFEPSYRRIRCFDKVVDFALAFEDADDSSSDDDEEECIGHKLKDYRAMQEKGSKKFSLSSMKKKFDDALNKALKRSKRKKTTLKSPSSLSSCPTTSVSSDLATSSSKNSSLNQSYCSTSTTPSTTTVSDDNSTSSGSLSSLINNPNSAATTSSLSNQTITTSSGTATVSSSPLIATPSSSSSFSNKTNHNAPSTLSSSVVVNDASSPCSATITSTSSFHADLLPPSNATTNTANINQPPISSFSNIPSPLSSPPTSFLATNIQSTNDTLSSSFLSSNSSLSLSTMQNQSSSLSAAPSSLNNPNSTTPSHPTTFTSNLSNQLDSSHSNNSTQRRRKRAVRPSLPLQRGWRAEYNKNRTMEQNRRYRSYHYKCCFPKCNNHDGMLNITCHEIPAPNDKNKKPMPDEKTARVRAIENWHCKEMRHDIVLDRLGIEKEDFNKSNMRLCNLHKWEMVPIKKTITRKNGKNVHLEWNVSVPCAVGVKNATAPITHDDSRGTAKERLEVNAWNETYENMEGNYGPSPAKKIRRLQIEKRKKISETASFLAHHLSSSEERPSFLSTDDEPPLPFSQESLESSQELITPYIANNLNFGKDEAMESVTIQSKIKNKVQKVKKKKMTAGRRGVRNTWKNRVNEKKKKTLTDPVVFPGNLCNAEIKRRTGFKSEKEMFKFIGIICDGDISKMTETKSQLTWYEEWMLYFEHLWGRTHSRFQDLAKLYKIPKKEVIYQIFDHRLYLALVCRSSWPTYAKYKEDQALRDSKWNAKYPTQRIIMWDDTNVPFNFKPSAAVNQRTTYSSYYSQNCAKGGVFCSSVDGWVLESYGLELQVTVIICKMQMRS